MHNVEERNGRDYLEDLDIERREILKLRFTEKTAFVTSITSSTQIIWLKCCVHTHTHTHTQLNIIINDAI